MPAPRKTSRERRDGADSRDLGPLQGVPRILVAGGRPAVQLVLRALQRVRARVQTARTAAEAIEQFESWQPHLVLVDADLGRPDGGLAIATHRMGSGRRLPAIVFADHNRGVAMRAFAAGADDFLSVPFAGDELAARIQAVLRRVYGDRAQLVPAIGIGPLEVDLLKQRVRLSGKPLRLSNTERMILYLLVANAGRTVARDTIIDTIWGTDFRPSSNVVDRHIGNLRAKLDDDDDDPQWIRTVRGVGYRFTPHDEFQS